MPEMPSLTGRVVFQYFYDVGGDIELERVSKQKLTLVERPHPRGPRILAPKYEEVGLQPLEVDLGEREIDNHRVRVEGRIFPIGVVGVYLSVEFKNASLESVIKLVGLNERRVGVGDKQVEFDEVPLGFFQGIQKTLKPAIVYPYEAFEPPEIYTLILISEPKLNARDFLRKFRRQTAGLLRGEPEWKTLSGKEAEDALKLYLSYSDKDIVSVDWYSALISGAAEYTDALVRMIELAKIQLLELKTYDKLLDRRIEHAYGSLRGAFVKPRMGVRWGSRKYGELTRTASELAELRVEVMDSVGDLRNILKFTGEWYLGKLYRVASERFNISGWLALVDKKLNRLQELYAMAIDHMNSYRSNTLELLILIVILIEFLVILVDVL
jgi:hypothetical protein